jgi:predicted ATPase
MPLAIELAAARLGVLSPADLADRLSAALGVLDRGARDAPPRQRTLRATLDWSYGLLAREEQKLLTLLSVFVGGATLDAIEAVCERDAVGLVAALVDNNLLQRLEVPEGIARFQLLETVREYALERLEESGNAERVRDRHAEYFLGFAQCAEPELASGRQAEWLARLDADHGNLRAAAERFLLRGVDALLAGARSRRRSASVAGRGAHAARSRSAAAGQGVVVGGTTGDGAERLRRRRTALFRSA